MINVNREAQQQLLKQLLDSNMPKEQREKLLKDLVNNMGNLDR